MIVYGPVFVAIGMRRLARGRLEKITQPLVAPRRVAPARFDAISLKSPFATGAEAPFLAEEMIPILKFQACFHCRFCGENREASCTAHGETNEAERESATIRSRVRHSMKLAKGLFTLFGQNLTNFFRLVVCVLGDSREEHQKLFRTLLGHFGRAFPK